MIVPADCETCGACCCFKDPTFVPLTVEDQDLLGAGVGPLTHEQEGQVYMRIGDGGYCAALDRSEGLARCSIYHRRPQLCREFQQGTPECRSVLISLGKK